MGKKFDYAKAMARLEEIAVKVEDPKTSLDDIAGLVKESRALIKDCRDYLRGVRASIESVENE